MKGKNWGKVGHGLRLSGCQPAWGRWWPLSYPFLPFPPLLFTAVKLSLSQPMSSLLLFLFSNYFQLGKRGGAVSSEHIIRWARMSVWPVRVACHACILFQLPSHSQAACWAERVRKKKTLLLCKHCSAKAIALLSHKSITQHYICIPEER